MQDLKNLDQLPEEVRKKFSPYVKGLLDLYPTQIIAAAVVGSAAGKNYIAGVSDVNSLFIFKEMDFVLLKLALKIVFSGFRQKISAPLFLTKAYIEDSLDVFPVEFLDMKENHVLVYGEDILGKLTISDKHLRLFCEQQIKGKLVRISQAYLEVGLRVKEMEKLLEGSLNALMPIFRNLIRLKKKTPAVDKIKILEQLCQEFSLAKSALVPIYEHRSLIKKISPRDIEGTLEKFLQELEKLSQAVNAL